MDYKTIDIRNWGTRLYNISTRMVTLYASDGHHAIAELCSINDQLIPCIRTLIDLKGLDFANEVYDYIKGRYEYDCVDLYHLINVYKRYDLLSDPIDWYNKITKEKCSYNIADLDVYGGN